MLMLFSSLTKPSPPIQSESMNNSTMTKMMRRSDGS